ncbi:uncharacterized protein BT62DRAFT_932669 [Guyanagaster necrorhizus]|uniref:Uncharacterized protein n=1 Tax=Guyanagaster necrorhizus TaxID=856835 RepID=A0A9P7VS23_9AGAR|nr:uncharacterized protein BT62DRAFT_932669 [Guyanagaster necrorhizus MCA 3950]KAG7445557.1 hypothetical protein BT62DRAFT_932669 [Guyanagaster necrorhizus MCA 3950]
MLLLIVSEAVREREENRTISWACHYFPSSTSGEVKVLEREAQRRKEEHCYVEGFMDVEGKEGKRL